MFINCGFVWCVLVFEEIVGCICVVFEDSVSEFCFCVYVWVVDEIFEE